MKSNKSLLKLISLALSASVAALCLVSCLGDDNSSNPNDIKVPENENKKEEIIINDDYASSSLISFDGTIDEIYDDGSMLVYSPFFGVNFNYMVIVESDENTTVDSFEPKINQCVRFDVYSAVKKSEPLTVVAKNLSLVKEISTQREEEEQSMREAEEALRSFLESQK